MFDHCALSFWPLSLKLAIFFWYKKCYFSVIRWKSETESCTQIFSSNCRRIQNKSEFLNTKKWPPALAKTCQMETEIASPIFEKSTLHCVQFKLKLVGNWLKYIIPGLYVMQIRYKRLHLFITFKVLTLWFNKKCGAKFNFWRKNGLPAKTKNLSNGNGSSFWWKQQQ